jgi:uncharacterized membrane protein
MSPSKRSGAALTAVIAMAALAALGVRSSSFAGGKPGGGGSSPPYVYTDLGGFAGGSFRQSEAHAISNADVQGVVSIAGFSYAFPGAFQHPAMWKVTGSGAVRSLLDLGTIGGVTDAKAHAVNDAGVATGATSYFNNLGFVSIPGKGMQPLAALGGGVSSGDGINNQGDVVGEAAIDGLPTWHGALWHVSGQGQVLGPIDLGTFIPNDINDDGIMVGGQGGVPAVASLDGNGVLHVTSLGTVTGQALSINIHGDVVGVISVNSALRAFVCRAGGAITQLPDLGGQSSSALDINDQGQIVGWAYKPKKGNQLTQVAVIWQNGTVADLNPLANAGSAGILHDASGINNASQIVGTVYLSTVSELHGYLLTLKP